MDDANTMPAPALNPNEAPDGYVAVAVEPGRGACDPCAFHGKSLQCRASNCTPGARTDKCNVLFVELPRPRPKTITTLVADGLKRCGYDGLYMPGTCCCTLAKLSPNACMSDACIPGVRQPDGTTCDVCAAGNPCGFHIGPEQAP